MLERDESSTTISNDISMHMNRKRMQANHKNRHPQYQLNHHDNVMQEEVFSDESAESTQAVYEEIEVQHQSGEIARGRGRGRRRGLAVSFEGHDDGSDNDGHGSDNDYSDSTAYMQQRHTQKQRPAVSKGRLRSSGKSIDSSSLSQEQSVSTWFPVPSLSLSMFQSKANNNNNTESKRVNMKSNSKSTFPLSSQESPFDEDQPDHDTSYSSSFHSGSPDHSFTKSNNNKQLPKPTMNSKREMRNIQNQKGNQIGNHFINNIHDRPWRSNSYSPKNYQKVESQTFSVEPYSSNHHNYDEEKPKVSPSSTNSYKTSNSQTSSPNGPSPRKYRNPFNSTQSTFVEQGQSIQSMKIHRHHDIPQFNPYKSSFTSSSANNNTKTATATATSITDSYHQSTANRRTISKSPERQRIIKPASSIMTNENKLHSLLSCATSPSDPKWMEALQILAHSPNPTQLAETKITRAHNWTALHIAALSNPPLYVIYGLLLVYPEAVRELDSGGRLPIHLAAGSEASVSVLSILVRFYDESVTIEEGRGLIPLHLALLRDGGEDMSTDIVRVLLGQSLSSSKGRNAARKVKDGGMRRGEHLNLKLTDVKSGIFGDNLSTISMKEQRKREIRLQNMNRQNNQLFSRGFASDIQEVDSADGIPYKHEHLTSLWEEEGVMEVDIFGNVELDEAKTFSAEVQQCLKKLANFGNKRKNDENIKPKDASQLDTSRTISPASIPAPKMRLPIHMAIKRNYMVPNSYRLSPKTQSDMMRILIHADPSSLIYKDYIGKTPLMTYLDLVDFDSEYPISLEMVELLLGLTTNVYRVAPEWMQDNDIMKTHQKLCNEWEDSNLIGCNVYNPAMVPFGQTLPLHVAVLKALPSPIIQTIYHCFPGAKYIQDERKCTPLHCLLKNSSDDSLVDMSIVCLLVDEQVVGERDVMNNTVLDLLIENGKNDRIPNYSANHLSLHFQGFPKKDVKSRFQLLFQHSFLQSSASSPFTSLENYDSLLALRYLPPWLRNHALDTSAVQNALITRIASQMSTALTIFNGVALLTLLLCFMSWLDDVLHQTDNTASTYTGTMTISSLYLAMNGFAHAITAFRLRIGWKSCILNIWSWVSLFGLLFIFATLIQYSIIEKGSGKVIDETFLVLATMSTGFLWAMVIGFISRWCYGVSFFCLSVVKMIQSLIPTCAVLTIFLISVMQMIYVSQRQSLLGSDKGQCIELDNEGNSQVCSVWEAIKLFYYLATGGEFHRSGQQSFGSNGLDVIYTLFITVTFIFLVHSVASYIINMKKYMINEYMVDFYWMPMLIHFVLVKDICNVITCGNRDCMVWGDSILSQKRFEMIWDFLWASLFEHSHRNSGNSKLKDLQRDDGNSCVTANILVVRLMGIILIPAWFILGLFTFGILWPPQCRRWIYSWSFDYGNIDKEREYVGKEISMNPISMLREDVSRMKGMVYERFHDIQVDLRDIKRA